MQMCEMRLHVQVGLSEKIKAGGGQVPKKVIEAPFVQIPLGVTEDRLVGTVDIEASMKVLSLSACLLTLLQVAFVRASLLSSRCSIKSCGKRSKNET